MIKSKREKHPSFHINGLVDLHHEVETSIFGWCGCHCPVHNVGDLENPKF